MTDISQKQFLNESNVKPVCLLPVNTIVFIILFLFSVLQLMEWRCKLCTSVESSLGTLLKHYRVNHGTFGHGYSVPCLHLNCPCTFKTWGGLSTHLRRCHDSKETEECEVRQSFRCKICDSFHPNTKDYFHHINSHLNRHETIECVFDRCDFTTNIYGTYATHKSRNHKGYSSKDFKTELIAKPPVCNENEIHFPLLESHDHEDIDTLELGCENDISSEIEKNIGSLLLKLESVYNVSGKCVDDLVEQLQFICTSSTQSIPKLVSDIFTKNNCAIDEATVSELVDKLCHSNPLSTALRQGGPFSSKFRREKYFKETFSLIEPVEYKLDPGKKSSGSFQYVPVLPSLQQVLKNEHILNYVLTKHPNISQLSSLHDGTYFKLNEFHDNEEFSISLILYIDDFEICNPLGTSRKKHKLTAVYWVLADVPCELRSQLTAINLALLTKANDVKKFHYETVLEPLLKDLKTLEEEGIFVLQLGKNIRGTVFCVSADNLGAHSLGGLVENFSGHYICRFCVGEHSDYQQKEVRSGAFPPRTKENYDLHVNSVKENPALVHYRGVKKGCPITEKLSHFHFVTGYPPDVLHDLFEGIIPVELALCLDLFIRKKYFTLTELNTSITTFPYKWTDKTDQPQPIPTNLASRKSIGGNAHENWALLRLLPFIIGSKIPQGDPAWQVLMSLKGITELVVSPKFTEESICYLDTLISEHRHRLLEVFPEQKLLPKHHFVEHYPELIRGFGPLVSLWTMRFEAKHSFFKRVVGNTYSFRNVLLSLASKHQRMMAYYSQENALKSATCVTKISSVPLEILDLGIQQSFKNVYPAQTSVNLTNAVIHHGTKYAAGMVLPYGSTGGQPDFVQISQIAIVDDNLSFIVKLFKGCYDGHYGAYVLEYTGNMTLLQHGELSDTYPLTAYYMGGKHMVTLKRHIICPL